MTRVYKILGRAEWARAEAAGVFTGSPVDVRDGYIHLSAAAQAPETARLHFGGRDDLVLVGMEADALGEALKWEASRGGALFPHLFAPLKTSLVDEVRDIPLDLDGVPQLGTLAP